MQAGIGPRLKTVTSDGVPFLHLLADKDDHEVIRERVSSLSELFRRSFKLQADNLRKTTSPADSPISFSILTSLKAAMHCTDCYCFSTSGASHGKLVLKNHKQK